MNNTTTRITPLIATAEEARPLSRLPQDDTLHDLAELFKLFGDVTRIKILWILLEGERCVCDIAELCGMTQSAISHQLKLLKAHKLVRSRRNGKAVFYALSDDHVKSIIEKGTEHIFE